MGTTDEWRWLDMREALDQDDRVPISLEPEASELPTPDVDQVKKTSESSTPAEKDEATKLVERPERTGLAGWAQAHFWPLMGVGAAVGASVLAFIQLTANADGTLNFLSKPLPLVAPVLGIAGSCAVGVGIRVWNSSRRQVSPERVTLSQGVAIAAPFVLGTTVALIAGALSLFDGEDLDADRGDSGKAGQNGPTRQPPERLRPRSLPSLPAIEMKTGSLEFGRGELWYQDRDRRTMELGIAKSGWNHGPFAAPRPEVVDLEPCGGDLYTSYGAGRVARISARTGRTLAAPEAYVFNADLSLVCAGRKWIYAARENTVARLHRRTLKQSSDWVPLGDHIDMLAAGDGLLYGADNENELVTVLNTEDHDPLYKIKDVADIGQLVPVGDALHVWHPHQECLSRIDVSPPRMKELSRGIALPVDARFFIPRGNQLGVIDDEGAFRVLDLDRQKLSEPIDIFEGVPAGVGFMAGRDRLVVVGVDKPVAQYDYSELRRLSRAKTRLDYKPCG